MLDADHAIALAGRRQRRAVREAAGFAATLGETVGFLRRTVPGGTIFEAVALESARTCAIVDEHGMLRLAPPATSREPSGPADGVGRPYAPATPRFSASARRAAERALAAARPRVEA
jgi:hypothetical protein